MNNSTLRQELDEIVRRQQHNTETIAHLKNIALQQRDHINEKNSFITRLSNELQDQKVISENLATEKLLMGCVIQFFENRVQQMEDENVIVPLHVNIQAPPLNTVGPPPSSDVTFSLTPVQVKYLVYGALAGLETGGMIFGTPCSRPSIITKKMVKKTVSKLFGKKKTVYQNCVGVPEKLPPAPAAVVV